MKVLVLGSGGFIGRAVVNELMKSHSVYIGDRVKAEGDNSYEVDLLNKASIVDLLKKINPEIIVNCAGSVENSEKAFTINPVISLNILQSITESGIKINKLIISGSAGEYGIVSSEGPVNEKAPLMGTSFYAQSKIFETSTALSFSETQGVPVVVARIFNPIGSGMHPRFLLPNLIKQIKEVSEGTRDTVELSRLDARRDYIDVIDIARAIKLIAEKDNSHNIYNIGSGSPITNGQLLEKISAKFNLQNKPYNVVETQPSPEPNYATWADITLISKDLGWKASIKLDETISNVLPN